MNLIKVNLIIDPTSVIMMGLGGVGVVVCASNNSGAGAAPVWVG